LIESLWLSIVLAENFRNKSRGKEGLIEEGFSWKGIFNVPSLPFFAIQSWKKIYGCQIGFAIIPKK
jgi:hypothetical protein